VEVPQRDQRRITRGPRLAGCDPCVADLHPREGSGCPTSNNHDELLPSYEDEAAAILRRDP